MPVGQGFFRTFEVVAESTYGVAPATPVAYRFRCMDPLTPNPTQANIPNRIYRGTRQLGKPFRDVVSGTVQVTLPLYLDEVGWFLKYALGAPETSGTGPYTHIFKAGFSGAAVGDIPVGLQLQIGYTDLSTPVYEIWTGCRVSDIVIPFGAGGPASVQVTFTGNPPTAAYATSPLDASPTAYTSSPLSMTDISAFTEGGSSNTEALGGEIRLTNELDTSQHTVNNSGKHGAMSSGAAVVSGMTRFMFSVQTLLNKAILGTESSIGATFTSGTSSMAIDVAELQYSRTGPKPGGGAGLITELPWDAFYGDHANASALKITLVNSVATY